MKTPRLVELQVSRQNGGDPHHPATMLAGEIESGRYRIEQEIGRGGMGVICEAEERTLRRPVAMKVLLDSGSERSQYRFIEEARITGQLEHPSIVPVHDLCVDAEGRIFYTMKLIKGQTLAEILRRLNAGAAQSIEQHDLATLLTIYQKVCDAVAFAHSKGVIHRDLKPDNIMVGDFGEVVVMDWGLAKVLPRHTSSSSAETAPAEVLPPEALSSTSEFAATIAADDSSPIKSEPLPRPSAPRSDASAEERVRSLREEDTHFAASIVGEVIGTPAFMAPEQARGEVSTLDERADIYALGAILYTILTLRPPVELCDEDVQELKRRRQAGKPLGPSFWRSIQPRIVDKVRQGEVALLFRAPANRSGKPLKKLPHLPDGTAPESLVPVVLKAMHLRREVRYETVKALQAEVAAYQSGFATSVEGAGAWKHFVLFVRRHRGISIATATGLLLIACVSAAFTWQVIAERDRTRRERDRAEAGESKARDQTELARANQQKAEEARNNALAAKHDAESLVHYLQYDVSDILENVGRLRMVESITQQVLGYCLKHPPEKGEIDAVHTHLRAHEQDGLLRLAKGDSAGALDAFKIANEHAAKLIELRGDEADWEDTARVSYFDLGLVHDARGEFDSAIELFAQAADIQRRLLAKNGAPRDWRRSLSYTCNKQGDVHRARKDFAEATQCYREAETIRRELVATEEDDSLAQSELGASLCRIGDVHLANAALDQAKRAFDEEKAIAEKLARKDPYNPRWQRELALALNRLGDVAGERDDFRGAADSYLAEQKLLDGLTQSDPDNVLWLSQYASSLMDLSAIHASQGQFDQALLIANRAREKAEAVTAKDKNNITWQRELVPCLDQLADLLLARGQAERALEQYDRESAIVGELVAKDPQNVAWRIELASVCQSQARAVLKMTAPDRAARAEAFIRKGLESCALAAAVDAKSKPVRDLERSLQEMLKPAPVVPPDEKRPTATSRIAVDRPAKGSAKGSVPKPPRNVEAVRPPSQPQTNLPKIQKPLERYSTPFRGGAPGG